MPRAVIGREFGPPENYKPVALPRQPSGSFSLKRWCARRDSNARPPLPRRLGILPARGAQLRQRLDRAWRAQSLPGSGQPRRASGNELIRTPEFTASLSANYRHELANGSALELSGTAFYSGEFYWDRNSRLREPAYY